MGKLIRPEPSPSVTGFVLVLRDPGGVGKTIRWVARVEGAPGVERGAPGGALRPEEPVRAMGIGWVVAVPAGMTGADINPDG